jgi:hypothetical protein
MEKFLRAGLISLIVENKQGSRIISKEYAIEPLEKNRIETEEITE